MKIPILFPADLPQRTLVAARRLRQRFNFFPPQTPPLESFHAGLSLGSLLLFTTLILTNLKSVSFYQQTLSARSKNLEAFEEKMERFRNLEPEFSALKKDLPLLESALPNDLQAPLFLNKLSLLSGKNQLTLTGVKLEKIDLEERKPYFTLLVNLDFQGDYPGITRALEDLEKDEQQLDMQSLLLRRPYLGTRLEGSLRLKTYYYTPTP